MITIEIDDSDFDAHGLDLSLVLRVLAGDVEYETATDGDVTDAEGEVVGTIKYTKEPK